MNTRIYSYTALVFASFIVDRRSTMNGESHISNWRVKPLDVDGTTFSVGCDASRGDTHVSSHRAINRWSFPGDAPINHYRDWVQSFAGATMASRWGSRTIELVQRTALPTKKAVRPCTTR